MTVAARAIAERKTFEHLSYRVATRCQSLSLPNMISMRLRCLYRRLSTARQCIAQQCHERGCAVRYLRTLTRTHGHRVLTSIMTVFSSPRLAARPAMICSMIACSWPVLNHWRSATHFHRFQRLWSGLCGPWSAFECSLGPMALGLSPSRQRKPLRLMKIIPLNKRRSSTRGLPWDWGKQDSGRAICAQVSRKRSDMFTARLRTRDPRHPTGVNGS